MSSDKLSDSAVTDVSAVVRRALPNNGPKRLAKLMDLKPGTARQWYYERVSSARCQELLEKLIAELRRESGDKMTLSLYLAELARRL